MKIIIADPFAPMRGPNPTPVPIPIPGPTSPAWTGPKVEKKWFMERRDEMRSSRPPAFFGRVQGTHARIDDPIADDWFR